MLDLRRGFLRPGDFHAHRIAQHRAGQTGHFGGHGGGKQRRLADHGQGRDDAADVLDEAQVQHPVGFVQDEGADRTQVQFACRDQVADPARGADNDVGATAHGLGLAEPAGAADNDDAAHARSGRQRADRLIDLQRQLAGRRQDYGAGGMRCRTNVFRSQMLQDGQHEGGGLAGPCLGDAQQIAALEKRGNGIRLNWRGRGELARREGTQQRFGEAECRERR